MNVKLNINGLDVADLPQLRWKVGQGFLARLRRAEVSIHRKGIDVRLDYAALFSVERHPGLCIIRVSFWRPEAAYILQITDRWPHVYFSRASIVLTNFTEDNEHDEDCYLYD